MRAVVLITTDGRVVLDDGSEMRLVVDDGGALGVREPERPSFEVDQEQPTYPRSPTMIELGLDQA